MMVIAISCRIPALSRLQTHPCVFGGNVIYLLLESNPRVPTARFPGSAAFSPLFVILSAAKDLRSLRDYSFPCSTFSSVPTQFGPLSPQLVMLTCLWSASFNSFKKIPTWKISGLQHGMKVSHLQSPPPLDNIVSFFYHCFPPPSRLIRQGSALTFKLKMGKSSISFFRDCYM